MNNTTTVALIFASALFASCTRMTMPVTNEELRNNSYPARSAKISVDYVSAYANLKYMYERCLVKDVYHISTQLDRQKRTAIINYLTSHGAIVSSMRISESKPGASEIVYLRAKPTVVLRHISDEALREIMDRETKWAYGTEKEC